MTNKWTVFRQTVRRTQTDRQTDRQTNRQTNRQLDVHRQTDKWTVFYATRFVLRTFSSQTFKSASCSGFSVSDDSLTSE